MSSERVQIEEYDESEELLENINNGKHRSSCGGLIATVNEYLKKPLIEHDLSTILTSYLTVLQESGIYIQNGIFNTNFAESALLLQASVQLYGKKVDLLWDFVIDYLNRNMSYEEITEENEDQFALLEERKTKFKRKRKILEEAEEMKKTPRKVFIVDKTTANVQGMCFEDFQQFLNEAPTTPETIPENSCYEENWFKRTSQGKSFDLDYNIRYGNSVPAQISHEQHLTHNVNSIITPVGAVPLQYDLSEVNIYGEREPMGDYGNSSTFDQINREFSSLHQQVHKHNIPESQLACDNMQDIVLQKWLTEKSMKIHQIYTKWDEFQADCRKYDANSYKFKTSTNYVDKLGKFACSLEAPLNSSNKDVDDIFDSLLARPLSCSSPLINSDKLKTELGGILEKGSEARRKTMDSDIESGVFESCSLNTDTSVFSEGIDIDNSLATPSVTACTSEIKVSNEIQTFADVDQTIVAEIGQGIKQKIKTAKNKLFVEDLDEDGNLIIKPKRQRRIKERLLPVLTVELKDFNKFFLQHYIPSQGEGELEQFEEDADDDEVLGDLPDFDSTFDNNNHSLNTSHTSDLSKFSDLATPLVNSTFNINHQSDSPQKSFADIMCLDTSTRLKHVLDWKKFIVEKIGNRKAEFDIHEEEANVIESIGEVGTSRKLNDMCVGKSAAEVSRNFIAMLHLANTHNVHISGIQPGKLSNDTLEIKLLSTNRHHEHLDEYNAPSTKTMEEKMTCAKMALKKHKEMNFVAEQKNNITK